MTIARGRIALVALLTTVAACSDRTILPSAVEGGGPALQSEIAKTVPSATPSAAQAAAGARWLMGYYAGYERSLYPEGAIDFSVLTHIMLGAIEATPSGGVTTDFWVDPVNGPIMARTISTRAHQAGRSAVLMLGGAGYRNALVAATTPAIMPTFVTNLISTMNSLGFDGIDVDWEPILPSDQVPLLGLVKRLRAAQPSMILTMPVGWVSSNTPTVDPWYATVARELDRMSVMTYGMADNWGGWVSWHQGALYGAGANHPSSVATSARPYVLAGVPRKKLGIGLGFFGSCWSGVSTMLQPLGPSARVIASDGAMSYVNIVSQYYSAPAYRWDATARAGYLSFAAPTGPKGCSMVSYEDPASVTEKGNALKAAGLGGAIIWTIGQGHFLGAPVGQQDPLLTVAYNAIVP